MEPEWKDQYLFAIWDIRVRTGTVSVKDLREHLKIESKNQLDFYDKLSILKNDLYIEYGFSVIDGEHMEESYIKVLPRGLMYFERFNSYTI
ncbi:MAG: hypothetical protein KAS67_03340 [Thermoplasmata archaeon]|nr:hypothetical protein [Thermoplasmata archaeon]